MTDRRPPIELVFLWHHHQPDYRSPRERRALLPWVRLHATKDYLDMALLLERHAGVKAAFNFVPSLLDQLAVAADGGDDALFDLLARPIASLEADERRELWRRCAMVPPHARERWPRLAALCVGAGRRAAAAETRDLLEIQIYFLLAWLDPMFHDAPEARRALERAGAGDEAARDALLAFHARLLRDVVPAYRRLAERGQVELTASAYYHPILPLLVDPQSARRARPDLPVATEASPMPEDARAQIERALARHADAFGARPSGVWPSEGSVSPEAAGLLAACGVRWIATDEGVLWRSLPQGQPRARLYRPWSFESRDGRIALFFRDRELSDRIGFVYHHWNAAEAVGDFLARVRRIGEEWREEGAPVVAVVLDGENCWEHYADDGNPFLEQLYRELAAAEDVVTRTPSEVLAARATLEPLPALHTGSWIDADFHIWMGHPEKNRAWDLLGRTRRALVEIAPTPADAPAAWEHLFAAEGSDWFWWYGDDHWTDDRALFDRIFREHLHGVFDALGRPAPGWLHVPVAAVSGRSEVLPPIGFVRPVVDGRRTNFYEWHPAGRVAPGPGGSMHRGGRTIREVHFGFDAERLVLRVDLERDAALAGRAIALDFVAPEAQRVLVSPLEDARPTVTREPEGGRRAPVAGAEAARGEILEVALPFASLGLEAGARVEWVVRLVEGAASVETLPAHDLIRWTVPDAGWEDGMWSA